MFNLYSNLLTIKLHLLKWYRVLILYLKPKYNRTTLMLFHLYYQYFFLKLFSQCLLKMDFYVNKWEMVQEMFIYQKIGKFIGWVSEIGFKKITVLWATALCWIWIFKALWGIQIQMFPPCRKNTWMWSVWDKLSINFSACSSYFRYLEVYFSNPSHQINIWELYHGLLNPLSRSLKRQRRREVHSH